MTTDAACNSESEIWQYQQAVFFKAYPQYAQAPLLDALNVQVKRLANLPSYSGKGSDDILIEAKRLVDECLGALTEENRAFGLISFGEKLLDVQCHFSRQGAALRFYLDNCFRFDEADSGKAAIVENICDQLDKGLELLEELNNNVKGGRK